MRGAIVGANDYSPLRIGGIGAAAAPEPLLEVRIPDGLGLAPEQRETLSGILALDPRPAYQREPGRVYGMPFCGKDVHFRVENDILTVIDYA